MPGSTTEPAGGHAGGRERRHRVTVRGEECPTREPDGHIHVDTDVNRNDAAVRHILAAAFGLAPDLPTEITTGCGLRVPYVMPFSHPERVTCPSRREHAAREHVCLAGTLESRPDLPAAPRGRAAHHRDLARRFRET